MFYVLFVVVVVSLLCIWLVPSAQDFMTSNTMWNGIRDFRSRFHIEAITSLDRLPGQPEKTTLVAIPYTEYTGEELARLKLFVNNGGTLLLMDDYGYGNAVLENLGVSARFAGVPLVDPLFCYKNEQLPMITDLAPEVKENGIGVLLLNHATILNNLEGAKVIAFTGKNDSLLEQISDLCLCIDTAYTSSAQEIHQLAYHIICDIVESSMFGDKS